MPQSKCKLLHSDQVKNRMVIKEETASLKGEYECGLICDVAHLEGAKAIAVFGEDYYSGHPCITENEFGKGKGIFIASDPETRMLEDLFSKYVKEKKIKENIFSSSKIEITKRKNKNGEFYFLLNHENEEIVVDLGRNAYFDMIGKFDLTGEITLNKKDIKILKKI